jgi:hypothetical protein
MADIQYQEQSEASCLDTGDYVGVVNFPNIVFFFGKTCPKDHSGSEIQIQFYKQTGESSKSMEGV